MRATKPTSTHQRVVSGIINAVEDRDIQEELLIISKEYQKALSGLYLAVTHLMEIDETCGTEHDEITYKIFNLISQTKESQISLLEMAAHGWNDGTK